jgi:hypothetical protein
MLVPITIIIVQAGRLSRTGAVTGASSWMSGSWPKWRAPAERS